MLRTPSGPLDDVVPATRPITVFDLLTFRAGYGFPSDFALPGVAPLFSELKQGPEPADVPAPDEWMATLSRIPLLNQPGEAWLYNTCSDIQGVLIARVSGRSLPEFLDERLFEPLGMVDTGFAVPAAKLDRFTSLYRIDPNGDPQLVDAPGGQWSSVPAFPSGAGGLVSTLDDWLAFARMMLADGTFDGRRLLSPASVRRMTTDHLTPAQREAGGLFIEGQGWGFGGSVDVGHDRAVERTGPLRLDRRHRHDGAPRPVHRNGHDHAQPAGDDGADAARADAGLLAVRGGRLRPPAACVARTDRAPAFRGPRVPDATPGSRRPDVMYRTPVNPP